MDPQNPDLSYSLHPSWWSTALTNCWSQEYEGQHLLTLYLLACHILTALDWTEREGWLHIDRGDIASVYGLHTAFTSLESHLLELEDNGFFFGITMTIPGITYSLMVLLRRGANTIHQFEPTPLLGIPYPPWVSCLPVTPRGHPTELITYCFRPARKDWEGTAGITLYLRASTC